jgi:sortase A
MRRVSLLLILGALALLGHSAWIEAKAWLAQGLIARAWDQSLAAEQPIKPWAWADTWPVARLLVPRLGVQRIVLAGVSGRTLAFGPGWAEQSASPGTTGRTLLAGHRDTHFHFLADLQRGDRLLLESDQGRIQPYRVVELMVVEADAGWLMAPGDQLELLLVTCYPFDTPVPGGNQRFLVRAEPI